VGDRTAAIPVTLGFVATERELLLLQVAAHRDRFAGHWNGVGGHVRPGESVRAAARREIREETGMDLDPQAIELRAVLHEVGLVGQAHLLFVFVARIAEARPVAPCAEGRLVWFPRSALPWAELVPDLRTLLPELLDGSGILYGSQHFDGGDRPLRLELERSR
jgi:8-oxo-dGTP diphosphatase